MDLENLILSEVRQRKTSITRYHLCVETKRLIQINSSEKEENLWLAKSRRQQGPGWRREARHWRHRLGFPSQERSRDEGPGVGKVWAAGRGRESLCEGRGVSRRQSGNRTPYGCQGSLGRVKQQQGDKIRSFSTRVKDRWTWCVAVHRVEKSWAWLTDWKTRSPLA